MSTAPAKAADIGQCDWVSRKGQLRNVSSQAKIVPEKSPAGGTTLMIIDAWMQHPNAEWIRNPMFDTLRRYFERFKGWNVNAARKAVSHDFKGNAHRRGSSIPIIEGVHTTDKGDAALIKGIIQHIQKGNADHRTLI